MSEPVSGSVLGVQAVSLTTATVAATKAVVNVVHNHETMIAGAAQSLLMAALAGALFSVLWYQGRSDPILPTEGAFGWRMFFGLLWRVALWGVGVIGFAFLTAWIATAYCLVKYGQIPPPAPPITGVLAIFSVPLLPLYQRLVEAVVARAGAPSGPRTGGAP